MLSESISATYLTIKISSFDTELIKSYLGFLDICTKMQKQILRFLKSYTARIFPFN